MKCMLQKCLIEVRVFFLCQKSEKNVKIREADKGILKDLYKNM